ncbi:MAG: hypothetical protein QXU99_03315 [Candidatus Bathyarchaeia archaeon]
MLTCYFRHISEIFRKAGIEVTKESSQKVDKVIHDIVGLNYKNCPAVWRQVKKQVAEDEAAFVAALKNAWDNQK